MVVNSNVFERIRVSGHDRKNSPSVCRFWKQGKCNRKPCRFVHGELPSPYPSKPRSNVYVRSSQSKPPSHATAPQKSNVAVYVRSSQSEPSSHATAPQKSNVAEVVVVAEDYQKKIKETVCQEWISGNCLKGDGCRFSHTWFRGDGLSMVTRLDGHGNSAVSGVSLPSGRDKLISGSSDGVVQAWDCNSGQIAGTLNAGGKIGCLISEDDWLYVGLPSMVKAWNLQSGAGYDLTGPTGQVYALEVGIGVVFAGAQDGAIWGWKTTADEQGNMFQPAAALIGHTTGVVSLRFGAGRLFSGSMDGTIKVWNGSTFQCIETFKAHEDAVMSLLCFSNYLLSCSLDHKIKVWGCNKEGRLEAVYTHEEADGALALCGVELKEKPLLLCSWNNDSVGVYELPSFAEKGRMYSKGEVRSIGEGPGGLVFTGDASGLLTVWKLAVEAKMVA
ncbi:Zinc finger CCCH domain-containing protein 48 [Linum perenne]